MAPPRVDPVPTAQMGGGHWAARLADQEETYGPHVVADLGAGTGRDLGLVRRLHPEAETLAVEGDPDYARQLEGLAHRILVADLERLRLPLEDASADLILANQVLEHVKEIFWIFHEVSRSLRVCGHFLIGVPNVCSLHNRLLLLFGGHPTQHKLRSAHLRPFSRRDTLDFLEACFPGGYSLRAFRGAQFYPFPRGTARLLARLFPEMAFSIFFLLRKEREYGGEFAGYPALARLETNFYAGG